jgi:hypothetical protein
MTESIKTSAIVPKKIVAHPCNPFCTADFFGGAVISAGLALGACSTLLMSEPQCLHLIAMAKIASPQSGHRFMASGVVDEGAGGCGCSGWAGSFIEFSPGDLGR